MADQLPSCRARPARCRSGPRAGRAAAPGSAPRDRHRGDVGIALAEPAAAVGDDRAVVAGRLDEPLDRGKVNPSRCSERIRAIGPGAHRCSARPDRGSPARRAAPSTGRHGCCGRSARTAPPARRSSSSRPRDSPSAFPLAATVRPYRRAWTGPYDRRRGGCPRRGARPAARASPGLPGRAARDGRTAARRHGRPAAGHRRGPRGLPPAAHRVDGVRGRHARLPRWLGGRPRRRRVTRMGRSAA